MSCRHARALVRGLLHLAGRPQVAARPHDQRQERQAGEDTIIVEDSPASRADHARACCVFTLCASAHTSTCFTFSEQASSLGFPGGIASSFHTFSGLLAEDESRRSTKEATGELMGEGRIQSPTSPTPSPPHALCVSLRPHNNGTTKLSLATKVYFIRQGPPTNA